MTNPLNAVAQWWRNWSTTRSNLAALACCGTGVRSEFLVEAPVVTGPERVAAENARERRLERVDAVIRHR